jgi:hypothetical protein
LRSAVPVNRLSNSVSTGPGATALTRTPDEAPSSAADLVIPLYRVLARRIKRRVGGPALVVEEILTMLPLPCASITRSSCFMLRNVPKTFASKVSA